MTSHVVVSKFTIKRNALQMLVQNLNWGLVVKEFLNVAGDLGAISNPS